MDENYCSYPCSNCIVKACCQKKCVLHYQFINYISNHMGTMTADELYDFRINSNTPIKVRRTIELFWKTKTRYEFSRDHYTGEGFYAPVG